jgi:hypothetical protein
MRSRLMLVAGALGLGAFWRRLRRRTPSTVSMPDPATELRERLAQTRVSVESSVGPVSAEEPVPAQTEGVQTPDPAALDPATRRRSIHERARDAMDELG